MDFSDQKLKSKTFLMYKKYMGFETVTLSLSILYFWEFCFHKGTTSVLSNYTALKGIKYIIVEGKSTKKSFYSLTLEVSGLHEFGKRNPTRSKI